MPHTMPRGNTGYMRQLSKPGKGRRHTVRLGEAMEKPRQAMGGRRGERLPDTATTDYEGNSQAMGGARGVIGRHNDARRDTARLWEEDAAR